MEEKALTFIGLGKVPDCRFAVPVLLSGTPYMTMDYLLLLQLHKDGAENEWSIMEKIMLITVQPLEADQDNITV